jgi:RES domain-containing protein
VTERIARDLQLLDLLDAHKGVSFEGDVWRIVREGIDVLQGYPAKARWDPGTFDVLYTSLEREGAIAEIYFHLSQQPVFPSLLRSRLHRIFVHTQRTLKLADLEAIEALGVSTESYSSLSYERTQEIGDAAAFLGFDGILAPSARHKAHNLIIFCDRFAAEDLTAIESEAVDWDAWRKARGPR